MKSNGLANWRNSARSRTAVPRLDQPAVRVRLEAVIAEWQRERATQGFLGDARHVLARRVRKLGMKWDTFSKKRRGWRGFTRSDLELIASAFADNPEWLATGRGTHGEEWIRAHLAALKRTRGKRQLGDPQIRVVREVRDGGGRLLARSGWERDRPRKRPRGRPPRVPKPMPGDFEAISTLEVRPETGG